MRKLLFITCAVSISLGLYAQKILPEAKTDIHSHSAKMHAIVEDMQFHSPTIVPTQPKISNRSINDITVVNIGGSANAYSLHSGGRTTLWADPNLNSVAFFHRMLLPPDGPGFGYIAYDVSTDGGNTWSVNNQLYDPTIPPGADARYPQGVLANPAGNTDPYNAYLVNVNPIVNAYGTSWGGIGTASIRMDGTRPSNQSWLSEGAFRSHVPDAMTVNPVSGDVFVVDKSLMFNNLFEYLDTLVITRGIVYSNGEIAWSQSLLYAPVNAFGTAVMDVKIAFAPDGLTGYISTLSDNGLDNFATGSGARYPILYKTTDGGLTWDEEPKVIALGGPEGLSGIINDLMDDLQWAEFWGDSIPAPARDEVIFTTAYSHDFAVDLNGNPIISVVIGVLGYYGILGIPSLGFASYNIFSQDGGETWAADKLGENLKTTYGNFGGQNGIYEFNRSQLTTTYNGTKMFFSWLDTDVEGQIENVQPDIFCVGWDAVTKAYTDVVNVSHQSEASQQAFMGTASYYAFTSGSDYTIPFVYQQMANVNNVVDITLPVQYKYISNFKFSEDDFTSAGIKEVLNPVAAISQNYPNPSGDFTSIDITLTKPASVSLEVYDIVGQKVYKVSAQNYPEGTHRIDVNTKRLKAGVYTYNVIANGQSTANKMMVN